MGTYINIGNYAFASIRNGEYTDKSELIDIVNGTLFTEHRFTCVTRSRRFGKSMAAKMLCAYYDKSCDSRQLFIDLKISKCPSYEKHLNKYSVIYLDMTDFTPKFSRDGNIVGEIQQELKEDILHEFPDVRDIKEKDNLIITLLKIAEQTGEQFFLIIDEWDAICRDLKPGSPEIDEYITWLRSMFKSVHAARVFAGVYLTGILPIKKYKTQAALNNFWEYSMVMPRQMDTFFGFTKDEVKELCGKYSMELDEMEKWYDGYRIGKQSSIFNPSSVMQAILSRECNSYWAATGAYDSVAQYIRMNFDGLKDDIINMLAGGKCKVNTTSFVNDMSIINNKDDVFTVLIHLGYLSYDRERGECYIPNKEVGGEMVNAVNANNWTVVSNALAASEDLLNATLAEDEEAVAAGIERVHDQETSILSYNNENSLSCVLSIAYYYAKNNYVFHRELPAGKGFADIVLVPRRHVDSPAILLELKYDKDADTAIKQIVEKNYVGVLSDYKGNILLVGINYDKKSKKHSCKIRRC